MDWRRATTVQAYRFMAVGRPRRVDRLGTVHRLRTVDRLRAVDRLRVVDRLRAVDRLGAVDRPRTVGRLWAVDLTPVYRLCTKQYSIYHCCHNERMCVRERCWGVTALL